MEKEQLIEEAVKSLREERRKLIDLIERAIKGDLTALVEAAALGQYSDFATNILTTLLTKHEDAVLAKISKEIGQRIDEWENSEDWDGTLNDGLYSLAQFVKSLSTTEPLTSNELEK